MADQKGAVEVIVELMEKNGYTPTKLGKRLGLTGTAIWDRLYNSRKKQRENSLDLKVSTMAQMLRGMDYKIVAVPANKRVMEDEYELT